MTNSTKYITMDKGKCDACWKCIDECKTEVLGKINIWFHKHIVIKHAEQCNGCRRCIKVCPHGVFTPIVIAKSHRKKTVMP